MIYNFSAGPASLPREVLIKSQSDLINFKSSGMSVMEMSHRSPIYMDIQEKANYLLRDLMAIPDTYDVLFLQGGASLQFTMVPLNICHSNSIGFIDTGIWSKKAIEEAKRLKKDTHILATGKKQRYTALPDLSQLNPTTSLDYLHITTNNTIEGTAYHALPSIDDVPLVGDMSSNILSNNYKTTDFDLIYAGAQKNIGPAGVTVVIIKKELMTYEKNCVPAMLTYKVHGDSHSLYNTPPTFSIYMMSLVLEWLKQFGGIKAMTQYNEEKSHLLYHYLDESDLFFSPVIKKDRSLTNIPFVTKDVATNEAFLMYAEKRGLLNLKGHRSVGGMRASLYNAMPKEGVIALIHCMQDFEREMRIIK